jgi:histidyl-tRNA synthetase
MAKRTFILDTIKHTFKQFGFQPLETPALENLSVLMGKYGEEGDQLLFKILNSGDFSSKLTEADWQSGAKALTLKVAEKGLRYDLTVPFARYVVMNRNALTMPFKRYQIQPVWRADRPQKGRYREFYQCDADVVGTSSLLCEAEIVVMLHQILRALGIQDFVVKVNNRKILTGITERIGAEGQEGTLCVAIDKLDKIGQENVLTELAERGFSETQLSALQPLFALNQAHSDFDSLTSALAEWLADSPTGLAGIEELRQVWTMVAAMKLPDPAFALDLTLARGLSYYTGAIFEVKALGVQIGSISGGGRYDNLTGTFGMPGLSGVGISLGVDRIYDVMEELGLFPDLASEGTRLLLAHTDAEAFAYGLSLLGRWRALGIATELYPDTAKLKKQLDYADKKKIPFVLLIGSEEIQTGLLTLKDMRSGEQIKGTFEDLAKHLYV